MNIGKTLLSTVVSAAVVSAIPATALAVPVVPNFTQGSMTSHTETTSKVTETINSIDYNTGTAEIMNVWPLNGVKRMKISI